MREAQRLESLQEFHRTPIRPALPSWSVRGHLCSAIAAAAALAAAGCLRAPPDAVSETDGGTLDSADAATARQLLADPDFEDRALDWTLEGNALIGTEDDLAIAFPPASGEVLAQLGRANDAVADRLRQAVTVPPWATALTLAGQRCFVSDDTDPTADDVLGIALEDRDGNVLEQVYTTSNTEIGGQCQWESFSLPAEAAHAGEDIVLTLTASTDELLPSVFWFDDLSLIATP